MRNLVIVAAFATLVAAPVYAQSTDVTGQWTLNAPLVMCTDLPVTTRPVPRLVVAGPGSLTGRYPMGNTGGANVSAFEPMPIPDDLQVYLKEVSSS